jgi:glycosyltransferase involved in cell wall biosynthesis
MKYPKGKIAVVTAVDRTFKGLLIAQIKAAQKEGYEVYGICSKERDYDWLRQQGIKMMPIRIKRRISPFSDLAAIWHMYRCFRREKFLIVHTHTPKASLLGQIAAKMAGVPVIINTVHGYYFHEHMKPLKRWFYIAMEWIASRCSTLILSQNPEDVETAVRLRICNPNKIKTLGNGVDLDKFNPNRFNENFKAEKRKEAGLPVDAIVIGIIGRLVKEKGFLELFEAFKEIIKEHDNVWLVIIGSEDTEKPDHISGQTFKEYGIKSKTLWLGKRDDIPELLTACDIYCLPSWREGFPRSAIEAAAMGLPIVTTNIRGCRQVVDDGVNGILVPFKDAHALSRAISKLVEDGELRKQMGSAGYQKAQKEFDERRICKTVIETYNHLLSAKGFPLLVKPGNGLY